MTNAAMAFRNGDVEQEMSLDLWVQDLLSIVNRVFATLRPWIEWILWKRGQQRTDRQSLLPTCRTGLMTCTRKTEHVVRATVGVLLLQRARHRAGDVLPFAVWCRGSRTRAGSVRSRNQSIPCSYPPRIPASACRFASSNFGIAIVYNNSPRQAFGTSGNGSPARRFLTRRARKSANGPMSSPTLAFSSAAI
jgi:hypothetical protein